MKTAVEWLVEQLMPKVLTAEQYYHIEKAKEMERQQIINAWADGNYNTDSNGNPSENYVISDNSYYQKIFKNSEQ